MSGKAMEWAIRKGRDYELDASTRIVAVALGYFANSGTGDIYPSLGTLEDYTGLSERQIRRCIKKLIAVGLLDYGDQSVVTANPRYRNDKLPKVYKFVEVPAARPDVSSVGQMPKKKRPWSWGKPTPAAPVDKAPPEPSRPVTVSRTAGQAGGLEVHQSFNPRTNPSAAADAGPAEDVDYHAGRVFREAIRARLALKGIHITTPIFAMEQ